MLLQIRRSLLIVLLVLLIAFLYTFLHEAGHAVAGILCGGTLHEFEGGFLSPTAHTLVLGRFSPVQRSLIQLAGTAFPLLLWAAFLLAAPRRVNPLLATFRTLTTTAVLATLLPWITTPLQHAGSDGPATSDVAQFLNASASSPWLLAASSAAVLVAGVVLFLRRIEGLPQELMALTACEEFFSAASRRHQALIASHKESARLCSA